MLIAAGKLVCDTFVSMFGLCAFAEQFYKKHCVSPIFPRQTPYMTAKLCAFQLQYFFSNITLHVDLAVGCNNLMESCIILAKCFNMLDCTATSKTPLFQLSTI